MALESSPLSCFLHIFSSLWYREMPLTHIHACNMMYQYDWISLSTQLEIWGRSIFNVIRVFHNVRIVLYIGCSGPDCNILILFRHWTTGPEHPVYRTICPQISNFVHINRLVSGWVWKSWPRSPAAPKSAVPEIYFSFPEEQRCALPYFFALPSANSIINNFHWKNTLVLPK